VLVLGLVSAWVQRFVFSWFSLDYFVLVLFAFVVLVFRTTRKD